MSTLSFCQIRLVVFDCAGQRQSLLNGTDPSLYTCCSVCEISKQGENQSLPLGFSSMKRLVMYLRRCKCVNLRGMFPQQEPGIVLSTLYVFIDKNLTQERWTIPSKCLSFTAETRNRTRNISAQESAPESVDSSLNDVWVLNRK